MCTPQFTPAPDSTIHAHLKPRPPSNFRRSFTSTTAINYDYHGSRQLLRPSHQAPPPPPAAALAPNDHPRLSIFQPAPSPYGHNGRSSSESVNLLAFGTPDKVYSSLPCLNNNLLQFGYGNGSGVGYGFGPAYGRDAIKQQDILVMNGKELTVSVCRAMISFWDHVFKEILKHKICGDNLKIVYILCAGNNAYGRMNFSGIPR